VPLSGACFLHNTEGGKFWLSPSTISLSLSASASQGLIGGIKAEGKGDGWLPREDRPKGQGEEATMVEGGARYREVGGIDRRQGRGCRAKVNAAIRYERRSAAFFRSEDTHKARERDVAQRLHNSITHTRGEGRRMNIDVATDFNNVIINLSHPKNHFLTKVA
jgi:hypothetical protein